LSIKISSDDTKNVDQLSTDIWVGVNVLRIKAAIVYYDLFRPE